MKFLIQKVKNLEIKNLKIQEPSILIYVGIEKGDEDKDISKILDYLENLEILDENGKFNKKLKEIKIPIVLVSQITLLADFSSKGRIDFDRALEKEKSKEIFEKIAEEFKKRGYKIFYTPFGSYLEIHSVNLGPINFIINI